MDKRQFSHRIGNVDESLVAAASGGAPKKGRVRPRLIAAAAALALMLGAGGWLALRGEEKVPGDGEDIPVGTLPDSGEKNTPDGEPALRGPDGGLQPPAPQ